ncbi:LOW QUALITY PROTEIN: cytochrome P450 2C8-like [Chlamydotis macqueenii]
MKCSGWRLIDLEVWRSGTGKLQAVVSGVSTFVKIEMGNSETGKTLSERQLPPGLIPPPVFATLTQLNFQFKRDLLMKLAKIHGNMFTRFVWAPVIILNGFQAVKDGMTMHPEDGSGRLVSPFFRAMAKGKGTEQQNAVEWAPPEMEEEFWRAEEELSKMKNEKELLLEIFPWLMCRLPGPHKKALSCCDVLSSFRRREIRMRTECGIPDELQDFIDFYLADIEKVRRSNIKKLDEPRSTHNEDNMVFSINDYFLGGSETTSTTLNWGLLYMVADPDIQEKVQKELKQLKCYEDWRELPYTAAVAHEVQHVSSIISVGVPRVCLRARTELVFFSFQDTIVLPNIASSLYDPEQWKTPQFNPGHFLDKDGNFVRQEAFSPFSAALLCKWQQSLRAAESYFVHVAVLAGRSGVKSKKSDSEGKYLRQKDKQCTLQCKSPSFNSPWKQEEKASLNREERRESDFWTLYFIHG